MNFPIIFLDIDGVLNDHVAHQNNYCGTKKECVDNFNLILKYVPEVKIVISSAWRYMIIQGSMTLKGFEQLLLTHGVNCYNKLIGITQSDEFITERSEQIADWIIKNNVEKYVVLDDLPLNIPKFVQTNGNIGLTVKLAEKVIGILNDT